MDLSEGQKSNGGGGGIPFPPPNLNQNSNNDSPHSSGGAEPVVKRVRNDLWTRFFSCLLMSFGCASSVDLKSQLDARLGCHQIKLAKHT